jgi:hypothetical protein
MEGLSLLVEAGHALSLNQRGLGELLGVSTRTVQRWFARRSAPVESHWHALARATHGAEPALAARLARQGSSSLERLGLVLQAPPPPPVAPAPSHDLRHLADAVVCVAAEAIDLPPGAIRLALRAAVGRARQMRLTLEDLEASLGEAKPPARVASAGPEKGRDERRRVRE